MQERRSPTRQRTQNGISGAAAATQAPKHIHTLTLHRHPHFLSLCLISLSLLLNHTSSPATLGPLDGRIGRYIPSNSFIASGVAYRCRLDFAGVPYHPLSTSVLSACPPLLRSALALRTAVDYQALASFRPSILCTTSHRIASLGALLFLPTNSRHSHASPSDRRIISSHHCNLAASVHALLP